MSRRKGEFEHRTSIFEGAYRAWSHLGGCDPDELILDNAAEELDPLTNPHTNDPRLLLQQQVSTQKSLNDSNSGAVDSVLGALATESQISSLDNAPNAAPRSSSIEYAYEPLPRQGLNHPFVQSIIAPWLGPQADKDDAMIGLNTLRTWWQHRRNGESATAIRALGTEKMRNVVAGYTQHFFKLCLDFVIRDQEPPPKTLVGLLMLDHNVSDMMRSKSSRTSRNSKISKGSKSVESTMNKKAKYQFDSHGINVVASMDIDLQQSNKNINGDPNKTPLVFVSSNGDIQISMHIQGITCGTCVKMIEAGLKGVEGCPTPIEGIVDVIADKDLAIVILKISDRDDAKRIAIEASNLLSLLGYTATAREIDIVDKNGIKMDTASLNAALDIIAANDAKVIFDWSCKCSCPDNDVIRDVCPRRSQINNLVVYAFENREKMLMTILEKSVPPPLNAPLKEAAPLNLTSTASLYAPNTIGNASSAIPTLCDNPATTTCLNPTFKGGNVAPTHHSFASTTTTIPLMYTHHQQPTLIQVGTGGPILMQQQASAPAQSQQFLSLVQGNQHNTTTLPLLNSAATSLLLRQTAQSMTQASAIQQGSYQQPIVLQQHQGLHYLMNHAQPPSAGNSTGLGTSNHLFQNANQNN